MQSIQLIIACNKHQLKRDRTLFAEQANINLQTKYSNTSISLYKSVLHNITFHSLTCSAPEPQQLHHGAARMPSKSCLMDASTCSADLASICSFTNSESLSSFSFNTEALFCWNCVRVCSKFMTALSIS